jgi:NAD(P)-dependent dehydrogenase (short-subunit alcohol dehydrogenase family)
MAMQKVVLITGVSSGIGEATAKALAGAGYRVSGGARTPPVPGAERLEMDVRKHTQVRRAVEHVLEKAAGTEPSAVAARTLSAIEGTYRMRHPAGRGARLLSALRRFAPAAPVDKGIRSTFGPKS